MTRKFIMSDALISKIVDGLCIMDSHSLGTKIESRSSYRYWSSYLINLFTFGIGFPLFSCVIGGLPFSWQFRADCSASV